MCKRVSTKDWTHEQWQEWRRKVSTIGGSDAGAILGLNKYKSAYALWAEKTGKIEPADLSDKEAVRLGNDLEQYVADRWMEATGKKLRRENAILYNPDYPWAHANIDRAVIGEPDAGFEAKTTSNWEVLKDCQQGNFPDSWYCQCYHYMAITGAKRWYLGVLVFGHGFFNFVIERNDDEVKMLMDAEKEFWQLVETKVPPAVDGSDTTLQAIRTIAGHSEDRSIDLDHMASDLRIYMEAGRQIKDLESRQAAAQARIMKAMGSAERATGAGYRVSWKTQTRSTFDKKAYEAAMGAIPAQYYKTSNTRPFKISAI